MICTHCWFFACFVRKKQKTGASENGTSVTTTVSSGHAAGRGTEQMGAARSASIITPITGISATHISVKSCFQAPDRPQVTGTGCRWRLYAAIIATSSRQQLTLPAVSVKTGGPHHHRAAHRGLSWEIRPQKYTQKQLIHSYFSQYIHPSMCFKMSFSHHGEPRQPVSLMDHPLPLG